MTGILAGDVDESYIALENLARADALKLRLSREKKRNASELTKPVSEPSEPKEEVIFDRSAIIAKVQQDHPGLTSADLKIMEHEMVKMGY